MYNYIYNIYIYLYLYIYIYLIYFDKLIYIYILCNIWFNHILQYGIVGLIGIEYISGHESQGMD